MPETTENIIPPLAQPTQAEVLEQLHRLLASKQFRDAPKKAAVLRYVVETTLLGEAEDAKQGKIGERLYGQQYKRVRWEGEKTVRIDNPIIRVHMHGIRARVLAYYENEGLNDLVEIEFLGGERKYAPSWKYRAIASKALEEANPESDKGTSAGAASIAAEEIPSDPVNRVVTSDVEDEFWQRWLPPLIVGILLKEERQEARTQYEFSPVSRSLVHRIDGPEVGESKRRCVTTRHGRTVRTGGLRDLIGKHVVLVRDLEWPLGIEIGLSESTSVYEASEENATEIIHEVVNRARGSMQPNVSDLYYTWDYENDIRVVAATRKIAHRLRQHFGGNPQTPMNGSVALELDDDDQNRVVLWSYRWSWGVGNASFLPASTGFWEERPEFDLRTPLIFNNLPRRNASLGDVWCRFFEI